MPQRLFTRVAVVQLAYHPAILLANRSPLEDPLGTEDSLRVLDELPEKLTQRLAALRARIRQTYLGQLRKKLVAVLGQCRSWGVGIVVLPEYSVPWQLLNDVVQASDQMVVVAGTHTVDRESRKSGIYAQLGAANPTLLSAVCPVLYRGRALALQAKLNPAKPEEGQMKPGTTWSPIELPDGLPGPMGALVCLDFLFRESPAHQRLVLPHLTDCRFLVVPSLTPTHTLGEFSAKAWEEARRYGRPVLYCDTAGLADKEGGGTSIFVDEGHPSDLRSFPEQVGYLDRGEEGVIVADVDLGYVHTGESTRYDWQRPVRPFAAANLLYGFHPSDLRYRAWLKESAAALPDEEAEAVESLSQRVDAGKAVLLDAAAMGGSSRGRRLRQLVKGHDHLQSVEDFQKRLREVELPDDVLPLPVLRGAMAGAVSDVLFDWQRETRDPKLAELSERLRKASESATKDRAERSESGTKSIGQVRESVIGTELQRSAPTPTVIHQVRQVLPTGIDPALLGVRQANGLTLRFAASVDALWMNSLRGLADDHMLPDGAAGTEGIKIVAGLRAADWFPAVGGIAGLKVRTPHPLAASPEHGTTRHPVADVVAGSERTSVRRVPSKESLDVLGTLLLLARAEGCGSCAVLSIEGSDSEKPFILPRDVFVIVSVGSGWELWFAPDDGQTKSEQANYQRALEEIGFSPLRFVPVAAEDVDKRIRLLLALFHSQPEQLRLRRDLKLREVAGHFVELQVQVGEQPQPGLLALDSWLDGNEQTALILGEFGSGKSTLLTEWCWRRAEQGITPLPVLVDLARAPATASGLDLLLWAVDIEPDSEAANRTRAALVLLTQNQLILPCFDGFDEMATRAGDLNPASRLSALLRVAAGGGRIIITARDHYFSTQSELEQTTSATLRETLGSSAGHRILRVLPLAKGQIAELVRSTLSDAQKSQQALLQIANTYDLTDLVQRPLLLAMVLQSLDRIQPGARVAPADVYEAYVQKWLEQTREDDASLPRDQKVRFAEALAEQLWRSGEPSCTWEALRESVRNRIGQVRLPEHVPDAAAFLDVQGGAFFVREGDDRYRFAHKSFLEYFLARALVRTLPQHPEEALTTRPLTQEVASFVGELLKREGDPRQALALRGLLPERELSDSGRGAQDSQVFRTNALRLLIGLAHWSGELIGWIPEGADLRGLRLWQFDLHGLSLRRVWLTGTDLSGADLSNADLTGADLSMARLVGAKLSGARVDGVSAEGADFSLASADRCSLRGANLRNANLTQSVWTHCNWQDVNLEGAELTRAGIWGATNLPETLVDLGVSHSSLSVVRRFAWSSVASLAWSQDCSLLALGHIDGTISIWDAVSSRCKATLRGHEDWVRAVGWSADGSKLVSGSDDRTVRLWDARSGEALATLRGHEGGVIAVGWSADGSKLVSGSSDRTVRLWDARSGESLATLRGHEGGVIAVGWSADGSKLVSGSDDSTVRLWDARSGEALATLRGHEGGVIAVGWSADGSKLVSGSNDRTVRLWDARSGEALATLRGHEGGVIAVGWSADGSKLVSGSNDRTVRLWDARSGEALATLRGHEGGVIAVGWSADGSKLVSGSNDRTVRLWDARSGEALATLRGHEGGVIAVGWSADGSKLVSGSNDRTVRLWDARSGEALATLWADGTQHTTLLSTGFYRSSADAEGELSLALQAPRAPQSNFYLPLTSGLRSFFNRPDYVDAALAGRPPTAEQRNAELLAAGFWGGTAWDGQPHRVPVKARSLPYEEPRAPDLSLRNPFRPGPAQDDVQRLPGRDEVVAELQSLIGSRSPAVLIGPRRSGKTSILRLLNRQHSSERRVLLLTLEGKQIGSADALALLVCSQLGLTDKPKRAKKTPRQHLSDQLQSIRPQPLFLVDEVIHLQDGDATLFPWLRALGQDLASIVYAGSPLDWVRVVQRAAKVAPGSSFGNDVTPVKLGPIADSDALRFLLDTSLGQIPESAARWVIEVCGPWPFYLQVMGHALFECILSGQRKPLLDRGAFLDLYEQRLLSDRAAPFTGRWEELPAPVRTLLLQPESLLARPVYLEQPQSVRRHLVDTGLCSPQGSWLADRPFFDWIRANASLLSSES